MSIMRRSPAQRRQLVFVARHTVRMALSDKLQVKPGHTVAVLAAPAGVDMGLPRTLADVDAASADVVLALVIHAADLDAARPAIDAARDDRLAWIAYPKAGQLGTDLNRDRLAALVRAQGAQPVRQVSVDAVWSALRFRPA
jgi:hypothetical protein